MRVRLTRALVEKTRPGPVRVFLWDTEVVGLGLVVHPSGRRTWVFQGEASGGGRVAMASSGLVEARRQAMALKAGVVPAESADGVASGASDLTVGALLDRWVKALAARPAPPVSLSKIVSCLDTHVRPRVASKPVASLTRADMLGIRDALVAQCKRGMANQTVAYFRAALRWAGDTALIAEAPRWRVARLRLPSRAHALNEDQWRQMLVALHDGRSGLHPIGRLALLALALTGCRKGEIAGLRWADVTDDGVRLTRHKTSAQTGPKTIEVHDALRCLLLDAKRTVTDLADTQPTVRLRDALLTSPFVFPSISRNGIGGRVGRVIEDTWAEVRRRAGLPASMTIHGLRGAFITQAQRLGVPLATVAAMVGHESPLTTLRHYSAPTRGEVAESVQRVATWITDRVGTRSEAAQPSALLASQDHPRSHARGRSG